MFRVIFLFPQKCISNAILWEKKDNSKLCNVYKHKWLVSMFTNKDFYEWFQLFPKWFVHFWMTFCKNSIRIPCQIIFENKHWPQSCPSPFKFLDNVFFLNKNNWSVKNILRIYWFETRNRHLALAICLFKYSRSSFYFNFNNDKK